MWPLASGEVGSERAGLHCLTLVGGQEFDGERELPNLGLVSPPALPQCPDGEDLFFIFLECPVDAERC